MIHAVDYWPSDLDYYNEMYPEAYEPGREYEAEQPPEWVLEAERVDRYMAKRGW